MKKTIAILLMLCVCIGLCACGNEDECPEDWDRIAEATATLNQFYNCSTEEEYKNILEKSATARDIQTLVEDAAFRSEIALSTSVRHVIFIGTYKGYDLFMSVQDYVYTEEYLAQMQAELSDVTYYPEGVTPTRSFALVGFNPIMPLKYEDGRYVISVDTNLLNKLSEVYPDCECNAGQIPVQGDILCDTCSGTGHIETEPEPGSLGTTLGYKAYLVCADCMGWGAKDTAYENCAICNGMGYNKAN